MIKVRQRYHAEWAAIDVTGISEEYTTGNRTESKNFDTSCESGIRHPKVHFLANLALRPEEKGVSHPGDPSLHSARTIL
ncbi:hypothetical protein C0J52_28027 [Blattella germanica]|nr:hypothetical protein C0J52_28027 [Blattella germanica]